MACTSPLDAWPAAPPARGIVFTPTKSYQGARAFSVPCGQCMACRLTKAQDWATRLHHESQLHELTSFITLTYDNDHLPRDGSLNPRTVELFLKRLRKAIGPFRYFLCGEYGTQTFRPHYHALIFGYDFPDRVLDDKGKRGDPLYRSATLDKAWGAGRCLIGNVTPSSAAYVARYVTKKANGELAKLNYRVTDPETGVTWQLEKEFIRMSTKPGIGYGWYQKYSMDAFPSDFVVVEGKRVPVPRYYAKLLERDDQVAAFHVKQQRKQEAKDETIKANNTESRLMTRHEFNQVAASRVERDFE